MVETRWSSPLVGAAFRVLLVAAMVLPLLNIHAAIASAPIVAFQATWQRTDLPVANGTVQRTWMWGPDAHGDAIAEPYLEADGASRTVQYYDKSRMELTDPDADVTSPWYVTNGLLVVELISGRMQIGDNTFVSMTPSSANVAGDPDDPNGPTYASLAGILSAPPAMSNTMLTDRLLRDGSVVPDDDLAAQRVRAAFVDDVTHHAIAEPFWTFMTSTGTIWDGNLVEDQLFESPFYATGRPITEAYWTTVRVGGAARDVLLQCFERRCLTYTPDNPAGWRVEAGNVGLHYYSWRYESGHDVTIESIARDSAALVQHPGGPTLSIPAFATSANGIITIAQSLNAQPQPDYALVGSAWDISLIGASVDAPIELALGTHLTGSDLDDALVAYFDEDAGVWQPVPTTINAETGQVRVITTHLSTWGVFVPADDSEVTPPTPPDPPSPPSPPSPPDESPNVPPTIDLNGPDGAGTSVALGVVGGAEAALVAPGATLSDEDDTSLESMVVNLLDAQDGSEEQVSVDAAPGIVLSRDADGHSLQIQGPATIGTFQAILRTLTYQHASRDASPGERRIVVRVHDGSDESETASAIVTVEPDPNHAPVAEGDSVTTDEDTAASIALVANDLDGDTLTWSIESPPAHGVLSGVAPDLTYTPAVDFHGVDSFTWSVSDGEFSSEIVAVSIMITSVNDAPVAHPQSVATLEDEPVQLTLTAEDADGDALTYATVEPPAHGTLLGSGPEYTYVPAANFAGADLFSFSVSDGTVQSEPAIVTVTVSAVDDPPVAQSQVITTDEDQAVDITLNAVDDSETLIFRIVASPSHGALTGDGPTVTYTPAENYFGDDAFSFVAFDGVADSEPATVAIQIAPVNDAPVASSQHVTLSEDGSVTITLVATDVDGDALSIALGDEPPTLGVVSGIDDVACSVAGAVMMCSLQVNYVPNANLFGDDAFSFTASDGTLTSQAQIDITVLSVNDPPTARDDSMEGVHEDAADVEIDVLANDSIEPDQGEALTIVGFSEFSAGGSARISGGRVLYTPAADFFGTETFRYSISDGNGGLDSATVSVEVLGVNDPPTAVDDAYELNEDGGPLVLDLMANDSIAPDVGETLRVFYWETPWLGTISVDPDTGEMLYTPEPNANGVDTFKYGIEDSNGAIADARVTITLVPVNDPPTASDDTAQMNEDSDTISIDVLANDTFAPDQGETLIITLVGSATLGTAAIADDGLSVSYTPIVDAFGTDSFTYTITDDGGATAEATVTVEIAPVNDAPQLAQATSAVAYVENAPPLEIAADLTVIDVDSQIVGATISLAARPDGAFEVLSIEASGGIASSMNSTTGAITLSGSASPEMYQQVLRTLRYVHESDVPTSGDRTVTISISDGEHQAAISVMVTVTAVNDPPVLGFGGTVVLDGAPVVLDDDATVIDMDSPDLASGQLTATISIGFATGDVLTITPSGPLSVSGDTLTWNDDAPVAVGTITRSAEQLVVTFTDSATPDRVAAVVRALTFSSTSATSANRAVAVVVTDGDGGTSLTGVVTVGVNRAPDDISVDGTALTEGIHDATTVGVVTGYDPDDDALTFSLAAGSDSRFVLVDVNGDWSLQTTSAATFDFETEPSIDVEIVASDPFGRTYSEVVTISITDMNEAPTLVMPASVELPENSPIDTIVATAGVSDADAGQTHTFTITAGNDTGAFQIDVTTGEITVADSTPLDYESVTSFVLTVSVTDSGAPSLSASGTLTVVITDVDEVVADTQPPTIGALSYGPLLGNLRLTATAADGFLSTSVDPEGSPVSLVAAEPLSGANSGSLTWDADGSFTYQPKTGLRSTTVTWQITVSDVAGNTVSANVNFEISSRLVWYVDQTYSGGASDGSWSSPYVAMYEVTNNSAVKVNDIIYVAAGVSPYAGPVELKPGQTLVGQGAVADSFAALVGAPELTCGTYLAPAINGARPTITATGGAGIKLSTGNVVLGLTIGETRDAAIQGAGASNDVGPTIRDVEITGTGANLGPALYVTGYSSASMSFVSIERKTSRASGALGVVHIAGRSGADWTFIVEGDLSLTSSAVRGLMLERLSTVDLRGAVTINTESYEGIYINATALELSGAHTHSVTTANAAGVYVRNESLFAVTAGSLAVSTSNSNALDVAESLVEMPGPGNTLSATYGAALWFYGVAIGSAGATFDSVSAAYATNGIAIDGLTSLGPLVIGPAGGAHAFGDGGVITSMSGPAVLLRYASNVTLRHLVIGESSATVDEAASKSRATDGAGIDAYYVSNLTLDHVKIARTGSHGIRGREVTNFAMRDSQIINAGDVGGEHALSFQGGDGDSLNGAAGTFTITDSIIASFWDTGIYMANYPDAATEMAVTITGTRFSGNAVAGGGVYILAASNSTIHVDVADCTYVNLQGQELVAASTGTGAIVLPEP
ncbi:MAG: Ig-like domain-containing protein [Thermomicrobiales bacterium]|nr:Ig-like domain-containing protein [Thermomicrobiales bacterium]